VSEKEVRLIMEITGKTNLSIEDVLLFIKHEVALGERLGNQNQILKAMYELLKKERGI